MCDVYMLLFFMDADVFEDTFLCMAVFNAIVVTVNTPQHIMEHARCIPTCPRHVWTYHSCADVELDIFVMCT